MPRKKKSANDGAAEEVSVTPLKLFKQKLPCPIDAATVHERSKEIARTIRERASMKEEKRETLAEYREKDNFYNETLERLASEVELETESRDVDCMDALDLARQVVETIRLDTHEVIATRPAEAKDVQVEIPDVGADGVEEGSKVTGDGKVFDIFAGKASGTVAKTDEATVEPEDDGIIPDDAEWTEGANPRPVTT
jgi:hypothetical protein